MQEKFILPRKLTDKEFSKKVLQKERSSLARTIIEERKKHYDKIADIKNKIINLEKELSISTDNLRVQEKKYDDLCTTRNIEVNKFIQKIKKPIAQILNISFSDDKRFNADIKKNHSEMDIIKLKLKNLHDEIESLKNIIKFDTTREKIKTMISRHYEKAEKMSKIWFNLQQKEVKNTMIRNDVFFVHSICHSSAYRLMHIRTSRHISLEDDLDTILILEPSISTSSIGYHSKKEKKLFNGDWDNQGSIGVIIGDGNINFGFINDMCSIPTKIKQRKQHYDNTGLDSFENIDKTIELSKQNSRYDEIVIDNAKIFGFYKKVCYDENKELKLFKNDLAKEVQSQMDIAKKRGIRCFVLTPDNRFFEFVSCDNKTIDIGVEILPQDIINEPCGMTANERLKIGETFIEKPIFRDINYFHEARQILANLNGKKDKSKLLFDDYLNYLQKNPVDMMEKLRCFPKELWNNKKFMLEVAKIDPVGILQFCSNVQSKLIYDIDFIKEYYLNIPEKFETPLVDFCYIPAEIINKDILLLALKHNDVSKYHFSYSTFNNPDLKEIILEQLIKDNLEIIKSAIKSATEDEIQVELEVAVYHKEWKDDQGQEKISTIWYDLRNLDFIRALNKEIVKNNLNIKIEKDPYVTAGGDAIITIL